MKTPEKEASSLHLDEKDEAKPTKEEETEASKILKNPP